MKIKTEFEVIDHSVSGEKFQLEYDPDVELFRTIPQPSPEKLPKYYESEDYISHTDSNRGLVENLYKTVRKFSIKRKLGMINNTTTTDKSILDFGSGTGDFLEAAQLNGWKITGIEPNDGAREIANMKTKGRVLEADAFWNLEESQFDVITLWHVLEHLPDPNVYIKAFRKLLKDTGTIIVAVPNFKSFDAQYYKSNWAAYDVPRHLWHFSKKAIEHIFSAHQFQLMAIKPMIFDSYYVSILSERYKNKSGNIFKAMAIGFLSNLKALRSGEYSSLIYKLNKRQQS